jgi:two-component system, NarL family, response regulator
LVADDNAAIRKMLGHLFAGHPTLEVCDEAVNGQDAVAKVIEHRPELVILDLTMPVMNGIDAAKAICDVQPDACIILFTMHADSIREADLAPYGINRVVSKNDVENLVRYAEELVPAV